MHSMYGVMASGFDPMTFLRNTFETMKTGGVLIVNIAGGLLLFAGAIMLIMKILKKGQDQMSWIWPIAALLVGGAFVLMANWQAFSNIASGGKETFEQLQNGPLTSAFRLHFWH